MIICKCHGMSYCLTCELLINFKHLKEKVGFLVTEANR